MSPVLYESHLEEAARAGGGQRQERRWARLPEGRVCRS